MTERRELSELVIELFRGSARVLLKRQHMHIKVKYYRKLLEAVISLLPVKSFRKVEHCWCKYLFIYGKV